VWCLYTATPLTPTPHPSSSSFFKEPGNRASKAYGKIADDFFVNDDLVATFKGVPFMTPAGPIKSNLKGKIS